MKKKKHNPFLKILLILFIVYISIFIAGESGYYDSEIKNQVIITEKNIKQFEKDVKEHKEIDINNYVNNNKKDYSGLASNLGDDVSSFFEKLFTEELGKMGKVLKKMFS